MRAKQHTSGLNRAHGCNLTSALELVLCGTVFALGVSFPSLRFWLLARRPVLLMPRAHTLAGFPRGTVSSIDFNKSFGWEGRLKVRVTSSYNLSRVGLWDLKKAWSFLVVLGSGLCKFQLCCFQAM